MRLVKGNRTSTTSPKSKGIVGRVFRIIPDGFKCRSACRRGSVGQQAFLTAKADKFHEIFDLNNLLGAERLDLLGQSAGICIHNKLQQRRVTEFYITRDSVDCPLVAIQECPAAPFQKSQ